jgi:hypothetical protein
VKIWTSSDFGHVIKGETEQGGLAHVKRMVKSGLGGGGELSFHPPSPLKA